MTPNREWHLRHLGHAEYARDYNRAEADIAWLDWKRTGRAEHFLRYRECVIAAWHMRGIARDAKARLAREEVA